MGDYCEFSNNALNEAIFTRKSVRAFTDKAVERGLITEIIRAAGRAPSGTNTQPWRIYALSGETKEQLSVKVCEAHDRDAVSGQAQDRAANASAIDYYPKKWFEPFAKRRRECGFGMYSLLGIDKSDTQSRHKQHQRNFKFFGAPVGLMCTVHRMLGRGSLVDYGMYLQTLMLAARGFGLSTCPQAAWLSYADIVLEHIGASPDEVLVCAVSIGYEDEHASVNKFKTTREDVQEVLQWV